MKRIMIAVSMAVLVFAAVSRAQAPAQTKTGTPEQEVLDLFEDWMNAEVKGDMAFIDQFLVEDWSVTDPVGNVWTKTQFLEGRKSGEGVVLSFELSNMKARIYGNVAVVTGRMTAKQMFQGKDISGQYQCTDTLIKNEGRWQCVATHLSMIPQCR